MSDCEDYRDALGQLRRFLSNFYLNECIQSALVYLTLVESEKRWLRECERSPGAKRQRTKSIQFQGFTTGSLQYPCGGETI